MSFNKKDIDLVFESLQNYKIEFENTSYFESYFEFVEFFKRIETIDYHSLVISSYFTYGWMPTILKKFNSTNVDEVIAILNKVKNHIEINSDEYIKLVDCVNNSIVGVSKLLHFINPTDYPIFDSRIKNYFKQNSLMESIWKPTYQNKNNDVEQYQLFKNLCLQMISDSRFQNIYDESVQKLRLTKELTKMRVLENLFFTFGKDKKNSKKENENIDIITDNSKENDLSIKEKLYLILKDENKPLTEKELVDLYVSKYPNYSENYKSTKTPPLQKIRGTIQSVLQQNTTHQFIKTDKTKNPYVYFITH